MNRCMFLRNRRTPNLAGRLYSTIQTEREPSKFSILGLLSKWKAPIRKTKSSHRVVRKIKSVPKDPRTIEFYREVETRKYRHISLHGKDKYGRTFADLSRLKPLQATKLQPTTDPEVAEEPLFKGLISRFPQFSLIEAAKAHQTSSHNVETISAGSKSSQDNRAADSNPPPYNPRPLPLSPLMDPAVIEAKQRRFAVKPSPLETRTELQQMLAKNPYALAMATEVRRCVLTGVALPKYFMQKFSMMAHPTTGKPWYVPGDLQKHSSQAPTESKEDKRESGSVPVVGFNSYILGNKLPISTVDRDSIVRVLIPQRIKQKSHAMKAATASKWREDMPEFVLELMRRRLFESLLYCVNLKRGYMVGCDSWSDALNKKQVGSFLWTGGAADSEIEHIPTEFSTLDIGYEKRYDGGIAKKQKKVPVHNLRTLLGREKLSDLRCKSNTDIFGCEVIALKEKLATVDLQLKLWKLQGYMAEHRWATESDGNEDESGDDLG